MSNIKKYLFTPILFLHFNLMGENSSFQDTNFKEHTLTFKEIISYHPHYLLDVTNHYLVDHFVMDIFHSFENANNIHAVKENLILSPNLETIKNQERQNLQDKQNAFQRMAKIILASQLSSLDFKDHFNSPFYYVSQKNNSNEIAENSHFEQPNEFPNNSDSFALPLTPLAPYYYSKDQLNQIEDENQEFIGYPPVWARMTPTVLPEMSYSNHLTSDLYFRFTGGEELGFDKTYETVGLFLTTAYAIGKIQPFVDLRYLHFEGGTSGCQLGIGFWKLNSKRERSAGLNLFYDAITLGTNYEELGIGFEKFFETIDFRLNSYIPIGKRQRCHNLNTIRYEDGYIAKRRRCNQELTGFDAELSTSLYKMGFYRNYNFYMGIGPYYFKGNQEIAGGRTRIGFQYLDYLQLEVRGTYDNVYEKEFLYTATLNIPLDLLFASWTNWGELNLADLFNGDNPDQVNQKDQLGQYFNIGPITRAGVLPMSSSCCRWKTNW